VAGEGYLAEYKETLQGEEFQILPIVHRNEVRMSRIFGKWLFRGLGANGPFQLNLEVVGLRAYKDRLSRQFEKKYLNGSGILV